MSTVRVSLLVFLGVLASAQASWAFTARSGERSVVGPGEVIRGDLFMAGDRVIVQGKVEGDLYAAGRQVIIEGEVTGDVVLAGEWITVADTGLVGQDLLFAARETVLQGPVRGYALGGGRWVRVNASLGGDARFVAEELVLGERARIGGDLRYHSGKDARIAEGHGWTGRCAGRLPGWT
ncbi:MAG: hypothetical protein ACOC8N_04970 [Spirochaetota bacterium]